MLAQSIAHPHDLSSNRMTAPMLVTPLSRSQQPRVTPALRTERPRLSLNINQARTFGKGSSLRLETLSAVSPTAINTFANAYEPERTPGSTSGRPIRPKLSIDSSIPATTAKLDPTASSTGDSRTPSSSSISSASTLDSAVIPYSISQVLNSILANSPLQPRVTPRRMFARPRFPAEKKVSFRTPLVEEIVNYKYTFASSDLEPSDYSDTGSTISLSSEDHDVEEEPVPPRSPNKRSSSESTLSLEQPSDTAGSPMASSSGSVRSYPIRGRKSMQRAQSKTKYPQAGDKRDSSSDEDSDTCPNTPVAGRKKRRREWVWTLGNLPGENNSMDRSDNSSTTATTPTLENTASTDNIASNECS